MGSPPNDNVQPTSSKRNNTVDTEVFDIANDDRIVDDGKNQHLKVVTNKNPFQHPSPTSMGPFTTSFSENAFQITFSRQIMT